MSIKHKFLKTITSHKLVAIGSAGVIVLGGATATVLLAARNSGHKTPIGILGALPGSSSGNTKAGENNTYSGQGGNAPEQTGQTASNNPASSKKTSAANNQAQIGSSGSSGGSTGGGSTSGGSSGSSGGGTTNSPPSAPTNARVGTAQSSFVRIDCDRASDSDGISKHELLRNGTVVASSTSASSVVGISDSSVSAGQTYTYTVRAVDTLGATGPQSNSVVVTVPTPDTTPPSVPTNFRITANNPGSITLAWDASTDNVTAQNDIWYIISSPLNESDFYTWTRTNPYTTGWFDTPGLSHDVYIQAVDIVGNESAKAGPVTFTAQ